MKKRYSLLILGLLSISIFAQEPCEPGERFATFDVNNVETSIYSSSLLWVSCDYSGNYTIPSCSIKTASELRQTSKTFL